MGKGNPKLSKLTNKELMESALNEIKSFGYTLYDIKLGNCYFVFEDEDDSICHFKIKEIPGFLFAFWNTCRFDSIEKQIEKSGIGNTWADGLQISPLSELVFFTQYEREIDKFKPSRSGFVHGIYRQAWYESEENNDMVRREEWHSYNLEEILEFMKKHRYQAYVHACRESKNIWESVSGIKAFKEYVFDTICYYKNRISDYIKLTYQKICSKNLARRLKTMNVIIFDRGECWSPRLQISFRRRKNISLDEYDKDLNRIDLFEMKHWNNISIDQWEVFIDKDSKHEDLEKDKELAEKFADLVKRIKDNNDEEMKLLYIKMEGKHE